MPDGEGASFGSSYPCQGRNGSPPATASTHPSHRNREHSPMWRKRAKALPKQACTVARYFLEVSKKRQHASEQFPNKGLTLAEFGLGMIF